MASAGVQHDGSEVLLVIDGRETRMCAAAALFIAQQLYQHGKLAEEIAERNSIIRDQAIILRAGVPSGLTNNPYLQAEAAKMAAWDSDLRRYMPGGVRSAEQFGTPTIVARPPRSKP